MLNRIYKYNVEFKFNQVKKEIEKLAATTKIIFCKLTNHRKITVTM